MIIDSKEKKSERAQLFLTQGYGKRVPGKLRMVLDEQRCESVECPHTHTHTLIKLLGFVGFVPMTFPGYTYHII